MELWGKKHTNKNEGAVLMRSVERCVSAGRSEEKFLGQA